MVRSAATPRVSNHESHGCVGATAPARKAPALMSPKSRLTRCFGGPDHGLLWNVVLRHDSGIITSIDKAAAPPSARRTFVIPALVNAHDHARPTASSFGAVGHALGELDHPLRVRHAARFPILPRRPRWRDRRGRAAGR